MDVPQFSSKDQEALYWKNLASQYLKEKTDAQQELDDFTEESGQLERELEASLEQAERVNKDLRSTVRNLQTELDSSRNKLDNAQKDWYSLESTYNALLSEKEKLVLYIRELEQKNDDLERSHRNVTESLASLGDRLNKAYEKNAMLESEVGEKDNLQVQLQRFMDEVRDLKQELKVKVPEGDKSLTNGHNNSYQNLSMDSNRLHCEMETQTAIQTSLNNTPIKQPILNGNTLTPGGRISAMNIVGDLLRKVGSLEAKISACASPGLESHTVIGDSRDSYRGRRLTRASAPIKPDYFH